MKRFLLLLVVMAGVVPLALALELVRFDSNNYNAWTYTRPGFVMTTDVINQDKVTLYKASNGDYTLVSPSIMKQQFDSVEVKVLGYSKQYTSPYYDPYLGSPTVEIINDNGEVLKSVFYEFEEKRLDHTFAVKFDVSDLVNGSSFKVRLACWQARIYDAFSVREVIVGRVLMPGDVDGDGSVTAGDITVLYNYLLNDDGENMVVGDQDGDGSITSADITFVYNVIIGG